MEFHCNLKADIHGTTLSWSTESNIKCSSFYFMKFVKNYILLLQTVQNPKPALKILAFKVGPEFRNLRINVLSRKSEKHNKILLEKPENKRPLVRPKPTWKNIKTDLKETACENVDWIHKTWNKVQRWLL
jgi:hypothetical protein